MENIKGKLEKIDEIIAALSEGNADVETSVELYRQATTYIDECAKILKEAKGKIRTIESISDDQ